MLIYHRVVQLPRQLQNGTAEHRHATHHIVTLEERPFIGSLIFGVGNSMSEKTPFVSKLTHG